MLFKKIATPLFFIFFISLFTSCGNSKIVEEEADTILPAIPKAILTTDWNAYRNTAPLGIENASITGNKMSISVKYSGGCKKHHFTLVGSKMVTSAVPPQRPIKLIHDHNNDECRELVEEILVFDISALAAGNGEITLFLDGYEEGLPYIPSK